MEWQPIETAPKDGENFVGWNRQHGQHECRIPRNVSHYKKIEAVYGVPHRLIWFRPTHWMPLPDPPQ